MADAARLLGVTDETLAAYLKTPDGRRLWERARAEGREDLAKTLRSSAEGGSAQAQKMLVELLRFDETADPMEARLLPTEVAKIFNRTAASIWARQAQGELPKPGPDKRYRIGDLIAGIPAIWDKLQVERQAVRRLKAQIGAAQQDKAEADRQLKLEQVRQRKRENDEAEGRLVDVEKVRREVERLARVVREQVQAMADQIILKLSLPDPAANRVRDHARRCLLACADAMKGGGSL